MKLIELLPDYYDENRTMQELQDILSEKTDAIEKELSLLMREFFPAYTSLLLERYEQIFGIQTDVTKPDSFREEQILAKIAGAGTTTKSMIKDVSCTYSDGEVEVIEDNAKSCFIIRFIGTLGIPKNMSGLKQTIEEIKPAHLAVEYEYIYNTWADAKKITWGQAIAYTWGQLREVKLNG